MISQNILVPTELVYVFENITKECRDITFLELRWRVVIIRKYGFPLLGSKRPVVSVPWGSNIYRTQRCKNVNLIIFLES